MEEFRKKTRTSIDLLRDQLATAKSPQLERLLEQIERLERAVSFQPLSTEAGPPVVAQASLRARRGPEGSRRE